MSVPKRMTIETPRLTLIGADQELLLADLSHRAALHDLLAALVPDDWPPELLDEGALRWFIDTEVNTAIGQPWRMFYLISRNSQPTLVGCCGFKGGPNIDGRVEIGYGMLASFRGNGLATEAVSALIELAYKYGALAVIAETYPTLPASIRVMQKCGMQFEGSGSEPSTIRYVHSLCQAGR